MKKALTLVFILALQQFLFSQKSTITGKVFDSLTNEPLVYASIQIAGRETGTTTDLNGGFKLLIEFPENVLIVSYVGYKTEKVICAANQKELIIKLSPMNYLLQEISVYSKQKSIEEAGLIKLQNNQIKIFAGMTKDALRSVQLLPGVSSNNEASAKINVRGGSTDENLVLINGVEVNEPYHFKEVKMASVGIFNIDMVSKIDFSAGGFSAEYGNALSSIMRINYLSGSRGNYKGKADISMVDLSLLYQGPVSKNSSFIIGVRKSYLEYLLKFLNIRSSVYVAFYDVQGQIDYIFSPASKIKFNFIYSRDDGDEAPTYETKSSNAYWKIAGKNILARQQINDYNEAVTDFSNTLISAVSSNTLSSKLTTETTVSYYNEYNNVTTLFQRKMSNDFKDNPQYWATYSDAKNRAEDLIIKTFSVKQDFLFQLSPYLSLKSGLVYRNLSYQSNKNLSETESLVSNTSRFPEATLVNYPPNPLNNDSTHLNTSSFRAEGYLEQTWQLSENLFFSSGLRLDYFDLNRRTKLSPRMSLTFNAGDDFTFRVAWGIFFQPPIFNQLRSGGSSADNTNFQKAVHYILSAGKTFSEIISLKIEAYYKSYADLIPVNRQSDGSLSYPVKENIGEGYASGIDFQFSAQAGNFNFWLSYGYLIAREKLTTDNLGYYPRYTDQTHTLSGSVSYDAGSGWSFNLRTFYGSGYAYTPSHSVLDSKNLIYKWVRGDKNSDHYPPYERVDFRITKDLELLGMPLQIYVDAMNVLNRKNIISLRYSFDETGQPRRIEQTLYGLIPTLGISYSF